MNKLTNIDETAVLLGISPATLREWVFRRKLPFVKLGKRVLFSQEDIERFIAENRVEVPK